MAETERHTWRGMVRDCEGRAQSRPQEGNSQGSPECTRREDLRNEETSKERGERLECTPFGDFRWRESLKCVALEDGGSLLGAPSPAHSETNE